MIVIVCLWCISLTVCVLLKTINPRLGLNRLPTWASIWACLRGPNANILSLAHSGQSMQNQNMSLICFHQIVLHIQGKMVCEIDTPNL